MIRRSPLAHLLPKLLSALLIAAFVASSMPPQAVRTGPRPLPIGPQPAAAAEASPAGVALPIQGSLRFAAVVDIDDNAASNPTAAKTVPVSRIGAPSSGDSAVGQQLPVDQAARYAVIALAVEVAPDSSSQNPAGTMVDFHLWDDSGQVDLTQRARADAWGAASGQFFLDDLSSEHLPVISLRHRNDRWLPQAV